MTEPLTERRLLKRLRELVGRVPASADTDDWVEVMTLNKAVLTLVLDSQEPMHKTRACYHRAEQVLDELEAFVSRRTAEDWKAVALSRN